LKPSMKSSISASLIAWAAWSRWSAGSTRGAGYCVQTLERLTSPGSVGSSAPVPRMVDPGRGARCAIRDTGAPGEGRYHWTVTVFGETDPVAGRTGELGKARSQAEGALLAYVEGGNDGPWALSWRLCRFLPTVRMRELSTQRDGHLCYGFVVQCRDRGRVRTDNDNGYIAPFSLAWVSETR